MSTALCMTLLNSLRFYITLLLSTLIFLWCQKRRQWWFPSMVGIFTAGVLGMTAINYFFPNNALKNLVVFVGAILVILVIAMACFVVCLEEALFCAVAGYSVQFGISLCGELGFHLMNLSSPQFFLLQMAVAAVVLPLAYLNFGRRLKRGQNMNLDRRRLLPLALGAVIAEIVLCYNLRTAWMTDISSEHMVYDVILLLLCSLFVLIILFALLVQRDLEDELQIISQLRRKDRDQYQIASETIEQINLKCHDMRHQIRSIGRSAQVNPDTLAEMEQTIDIYDTITETGCRALDIILTEKSLYCKSNNIAIHCIADGRKLSFLRDVDIYSLFGNLLDNAIHAVQELEESQRVIYLTVKAHGELLSINSSNRYVGELTMRDGIPVTRGDQKHHGFGTKSIVTVINKYGGTVSFHAKDGEFNLNILFSLSEY